MKLAIAVRRNDFFPPGTWVEVTDDGVQEVEIRQNGSTIEYVRSIGFIYPADLVADVLQPVNVRGMQFINRSR